MNANGDSGFQPLTKFQKNIPHFATTGGLILMLFAMGIQNAAASNPDLLKDWGNTEDLTKMAGAVITLMGVALAHGNTKTTEAAIEKAAKAPPVDKDGNVSVGHTVSVAIGQAISSQDHDLAKRLIDALAPTGSSDKRLLGPEEVQQRGAA